MKKTTSPASPGATPWTPADLDSLKALCERADRIEGRGAFYLSQPLNDLLGLLDCERDRLLADVAAHPVYSRLARGLPRLAAPAVSPFAPLRRAYAIADVARLPLSKADRRPTSSRRALPPGKAAERERGAIRRLLQVTSSPMLKRVCADRLQELQRQVPIKWRSVEHPELLMLAWRLWLDADTVDPRLLREAGDMCGIVCDDSTASRYVTATCERIFPDHKPWTAPPSAPKPVPFQGLLGPFNPTNND
jgi:hypothetical protein